MMPPPESHLTLSPPEKALLTRWIREGAEYRNHWSLEPIAANIACHRSPRTARRAQRQPRSTRSSCEARRGGCHGGAARVTRELIARRLALRSHRPAADARGDRCVRRRSRPDAYARLVDRYLASPAYGERMAMDWLDLARYADTYGYQDDVARDMSAYRDWVISRLQRQSSLRSISHLAARRRSPAATRPAISASPPPSIACIARPTKAAASRRSSAPSTSSTASTRSARRCWG